MAKPIQTLIDRLGASSSAVKGNKDAVQNTAPDAASDTMIVMESETASGTVLGNDSDADGDALSVVAVNGKSAKVGQQTALASGASSWKDGRIISRASD